MKYLILFTTLIFAGELEVDGDLKVTGTVDANGNPITNVGAPLLSTDAASAGCVLSATGGKGRIIALKCGWVSACHNEWCTPSLGSCEPPTCPVGWNELTTFNETSGAGGEGRYHYLLSGNSVRYCMEQEEE